jgi:hypothetical protein
VNARTLSGSIRSAAIRPGTAPAPVPAPPPVRTETRNGVLYVVDRAGGLSPVASPAIAQSYARALRGAGLL